MIVTIENGGIRTLDFSLKILWDVNRVIKLLVIRVNFIVERERERERERSCRTYGLGAY